MANPEVDRKKLCSELEAMGLSVTQATRSLHYSGNTNLQDALNWFFDHENDADADQIPLAPVDIDIGIESPNSFPVSEEVKRKAHQLRTRAREEEKGKVEREMDKAKRRKLEIVLENLVNLQPSTPAVQEKKNPLPLKSSTLVECMGECLRNLKRHYKDDNSRVTRTFETLLIYVGNVVKNPDEEKYRKIRLNNPSFQKRVGTMKGGIEFLILCGFEMAEGGEFLFLPQSKVNMEILNSAGTELKSALTNPYFGLLSKR